MIAYPTAYAPTLPVGRIMPRAPQTRLNRSSKKGSPLVDRFVGFDSDVIADIEKLADEEGISFPEFVRRAVDEKLNPVPVEHPDMESAPLLDLRVACGPPSEASDASRPFPLSQEIADEIGLADGDYFVRARDISMEGAGIFDEFLVLMAPLKGGRLPRRGDISLVRFTKEDETPTGTIKRWDGVDANGFPRLVDGNGDPFPTPEGWDIEPIATAKAILGAL